MEVSMHRWIALALVATLGVGVTAVSTREASAQAREPWPVWKRADGYTYYKRSRSRAPRHGYEGFAGPPLRASYCSYVRIPNRTCSNGRCRVTSWTLEQYCQ
jgi:hypothetical protein